MFPRSFYQFVTYCTPYVLGIVQGQVEDPALEGYYIFDLQASGDTLVVANYHEGCILQYRINNN